MQVHNKCTYTEYHYCMFIAITRISLQLSATMQFLYTQPSPISPPTTSTANHPI